MVFLAEEHTKTCEVGKAEGVDKSCEVPQSSENTILPVSPDLPDSIKNAVEQLKEDIVSLNDSEDHLAFMMAVNVNTAKAELVPIPTLGNMTRLMAHLDQLPEGVQNALKKNISETDKQAMFSIWRFLEQREATIRISQSFREQDNISDKEIRETNNVDSQTDQDS